MAGRPKSEQQAAAKKAIKGCLEAQVHPWTAKYRFPEVQDATWRLWVRTVCAETGLPMPPKPGSKPTFQDTRPPPPPPPEPAKPPKSKAKNGKHIPKGTPEPKDPLDAAYGVRYGPSPDDKSYTMVQAGQAVTMAYGSDPLAAIDPWREIGAMERLQHGWRHAQAVLESCYLRTDDGRSLVLDRSAMLSAIDQMRKGTVEMVKLMEQVHGQNEIRVIARALMSRLQSLDPAAAVQVAKELQQAVRALSSTAWAQTHST